MNQLNTNDAASIAAGLGITDPDNIEVTAFEAVWTLPVDTACAVGADMAEVRCEWIGDGLEWAITTYSDDTRSETRHPITVPEDGRNIAWAAANTVRSWFAARLAERDGAAR